MQDISELVRWAEKKYRIKCPRITWSRHFPLPGADSAYCSGEGETPSHEPVIVIWKGSDRPAFLFLHEFQHFLGEKNEKKCDYLAQCDLLKYLIEKDMQKESEEYRAKVSSA